MSSFGNPSNLFGGRTDIESLTRQAGVNLGNQDIHDLAQKLGGRVAGPNLIMAPGGPGLVNSPNRYIVPPMQQFQQPGPTGLQGQFEQGVWNDLGRLQGAEQFNWENQMGAAGQVGQLTDQVRNRIEGPVAGQMNELDQLGEQYGQLGQQAMSQFGFDSNSILGQLDSGIGRAEQDIGGAYGKGDLAEQRMQDTIGEFRNRTSQDEASAVRGLHAENDAYSRQIEADPGLTHEQKMALQAQARENLMPRVSQTLTSIGNNFNNTLASLGTHLSDLTQANANLHMSGAGLKGQLAQGRAGVATNLAEQRQQVAQFQASMLNAKQGVTMAKAQLRNAASMAALQAEMQGRTWLADFIRGSPLSPVSIASAIAAIMSSRTIPGQAGQPASRPRQ